MRERERGGGREGKSESTLRGGEGEMKRAVYVGPDL